MTGRSRQSIGLGKVNRELDPCRRRVGHPEDTQTAHLQEPSEGGRGVRGAVLDDYLVIGDQLESARQQPERKVGLADAGRTQQQHSRAITGNARPMHPCHLRHEFTL